MEKLSTIADYRFAHGLKVNAAEMVKIWEDMNVCAPGDVMGTTGGRCHKYDHNCHRCMTEFAGKKEFTAVNQIDDAQTI